jgi:PIN domain nuclease of toxin-antitoxin system
MRLLVDTHAFLWMILDPDRLSPSAKRRLRDPSTEKHLSIASIWEMAIKISLGKLRLDDPLEDIIEVEALQNDVSILTIRPVHAIAVAGLPFHHRDPIDRLIVCQAIEEDLRILSSDDAFDAYDVERLW